MKHPIISTAINDYNKGFGKFWKVKEIDNASFQDMENFRKGKIFNMAMEKFWIFIQEILQYPKIDIK